MKQKFSACFNTVCRETSLSKDCADFEPIGNVLLSSRFEKTNLPFPKGLGYLRVNLVNRESNEQYPGYCAFPFCSGANQIKAEGMTGMRPWNYLEKAGEEIQSDRPVWIEPAEFFAGPGWSFLQRREGGEETTIYYKKVRFEAGVSYLQCAWLRGAQMEFGVRFLNEDLQQLAVSLCPSEESSSWIWVHQILSLENRGVYIKIPDRTFWIQPFLRVRGASSVAAPYFGGAATK